VERPLKKFFISRGTVAYENFYGPEKVDSLERNSIAAKFLSRKFIYKNLLYILRKDKLTHCFLYFCINYTYSVKHNTAQRVDKCGLFSNNTHRNGFHTDRISVTLENHKF